MTDAGLAGVEFGPRAALAVLCRHHPRYRLVRDRDRLDLWRRQFVEYFEGERRRFSLGVDLAGVRSRFRRRVLECCRQIPFGELVTYGELAGRAGAPRAARAVGGAMAANPIPIVIPCHRVVAAGGKPGGFAPGLDYKRTLLGLEGVRLGGWGRGGAVSPRRSGHRGWERS